MICEHTDLRCGIEFSTDVLEGIAKLVNPGPVPVPFPPTPVTVYPKTARMQWKAFAPTVLIEPVAR